MAAPTEEFSSERLVIGGGLAGSLLALALRERGLAVTLLDPGSGDTATALSYGVIPGWPLAATALARLAPQAGARWRALEDRHGALGWHPAHWRLPLPVSQVDGEAFGQRLPVALAAAGVEVRRGQAQSLERSGSGWRVHLVEGPPLQAAEVVLAAGSGCRALWPALPARLRSSWAGVLQLQERPPDLSPDQLQLPLQFQRPELERRAPELGAEAWIVDPGVVPRGRGALVGQLTLVRAAATGSGAPADPEPDRHRMEQRLRRGLEPLTLAWQAVPARYRQAPVSFCSEGQPLAGPVAGAPGLWVFSGFSGGFAQVPVLAPLLAACLADPGGPALDALQRLGVLPQAAG